MGALELPTLATSMCSSACPHLAQGISKSSLALPKVFPFDLVPFLLSHAFLSFFQGAEPAHNFFQTLPKILHTLKEAV